MFDKAKKKAPAKSAKKDEKISVKVQNNPKFDNAVNTAAINDTKIKELKAELDSAKTLINEIAREEYAKLYESNKRNVGSFNLVSDNGASFMFLPTKRYLKVTEDRAEHLKETYGEDTVEENTTYGFNSTILEKHMDAIADLLMKADFMTDEEKDALIVANTSYNVKKDILDNFYVLKTEKEIEIEDAIEDFAPVCQIKYLKPSKKA
jgi:hypothetical protein